MKVFVVSECKDDARVPVAVFSSVDKITTHYRILTNDPMPGTWEVDGFEVDALTAGDAVAP